MNDSTQRIDATWVYTGLSLLACCLLSFLLYSHGAPASCVLPAALCLIAIVTRLSFLLFLIPHVVFVVVAIAWVFGPLTPELVDDQVFAVAVFGAIALSSRLQCLMFPRLHQVVTGRVTYTPTNSDESRQLAASHAFSVGLISVAWLVAGYLTSDLTLAVADPEKFAQYRNLLNKTVRLDPWAYSAIEIVIILGTVFAIVHGLLSYLRCRWNDGMMAAMLLRHELWRWNGSEQKMIAKALKNQE